MNVRARGKIPHQEWPRIAERFRGGETLAEIARSYGCTAPAIRYIIGRVARQAEAPAAAAVPPAAAVVEEASVAGPPADRRRRTAQVVSVADRANATARDLAATTTDGIWDRISTEIASFLAGMDALSEEDSEQNYEALLIAIDRLLWASARTRLELERVIGSRKVGAGKIDNRRRAP